MKIVVCIRQGLDGEINPFDACAYEAALCIENAQITLLSMGAAKTCEFLTKLTRLGATEAILLSDPAFAGADTLATAYALSLAIKKLQPDLIVCGRQTLIGDTGQVPPMLSAITGFDIITNAMDIKLSATKVICNTREEGVLSASFPAIVTVERINTLRLPSIRSKAKECFTWNAKDIGADISKCGLKGSPTRVLETFENSSGRRKCKFISMSELDGVIKDSLQKGKKVTGSNTNTQKLKKVCIIGEKPMEFAKTVCDNICTIELTDATDIIEKIKQHSPDAVLWASDSKSKRLSGIVAGKMALGLCADCTELSAHDGTLIMYRPALSGSIIAKIKSLTVPAMATVRTKSDISEDIIVAAGFGCEHSIEKVKAFADSLGATLAASRKVVDRGVLPYDMQVGLTGKTVSPPIYIAVGISGAVHHIVGMQRSGTVIAINPDKDAPIFDYADFGIIENF